MKKIVLILICLMFMGNVKAETKEELERLLNEKFPNDTYTVNALSPKDYVSNYDDNLKQYSNYVENKLLPFEINGYIFQLKIEGSKSVISDDYNKATFIYENDTFEVTKELNLKWAEFNNEYEKKVDNYLSKSKKTILTDLNYVNYKLKNYKNLFIPNLEKEEHITYTEESADRGCYYGDTDYLNLTVEKACSIIIIMYDNIIYKVLEPNAHINDENDKILKLYSYEVVYIPSDTKEDKNSYMEEAKKRIDNNLKTNIKVEEYIIEDTLPNKEDRQNYLKTQLEYGYKNNYIDQNLNKFEPIFAKATYEDDYEDYIFYFIIAKGTNKQLGIISNIGEKCSEKDGKYYDKNGNSVSKEAYFESCGVVENPKTGIILSLTTLIIFTILGIYILLKKNYLKKI